MSISNIGSSPGGISNVNSQGGSPSPYSNLPCISCSYPGNSSDPAIKGHYKTMIDTKSGSYVNPNSFNIPNDFTGWYPSLSTFSKWRKKTKRIVNGVCEETITYGGTGSQSWIVRSLDPFHGYVSRVESQNFELVSQNENTWHDFWPNPMGPNASFWNGQLYSSLTAVGTMQILLPEPDIIISDTTSVRKYNDRAGTIVNWERVLSDKITDCPEPFINDCCLYQADQLGVSFEAEDLPESILVSMFITGDGGENGVQYTGVTFTKSGTTYNGTLSGGVGVGSYSGDAFDGDYTISPFEIVEGYPTWVFNPYGDFVYDSVCLIGSEGNATNILGFTVGDQFAGTYDITMSSPNRNATLTRSSLCVWSIDAEDCPDGQAWSESYIPNFYKGSYLTYDNGWVLFVVFAYNTMGDNDEEVTICHREQYRKSTLDNPDGDPENSPLGTYYDVDNLWSPIVVS